MNTCLICGKHGIGGIHFDGYWFDSEECVNVYCAFMGIEYRPQQIHTEVIYAA